jgi:hypothetical protein
MTKIYLLWFRGGTCGTFISQFINTHTNFISQPTGKIITSPRPHIPAGSSHIERTRAAIDTVYIAKNYDAIKSSTSDKSYENRNNITRFNNYAKETGNSPSPKIYDYNLNGDINIHYKSANDRICLIPYDHSFAFATDHTSFFSTWPYSLYNLVITVPRTPMFSRFSKSRKQLMIDKLFDQQDRACHTFTNMERPYHSLDIYELLKCNENEYNNLLDFIDQPPLDNWKELITDYRTAIKY